jgi:AcrR family transcriptional regulator
VAEARRLFLARGVEETSISDIVSAVGVAQGTFYWHFASKEEVLNAVVAEITADLRAETEIAVASVLSATRKFLRMWEMWFTVINRNAALMGGFHRGGNRESHDRLAQEVVRSFVPMVGQIIAQGVAEGAFTTKYPDEAASFIAALFEAAHDEMFFRRGEAADRRIDALWDFALMGLGCTVPLKPPR